VGLRCVKQNNANSCFANRFPCDRQMPHIAKQQGTAAILEKLRNLIRMKRRVQRNSRATGRDDAKVSSDPTRMVVGQDRSPGTRLKSFFRKPAADALSHPPGLGVGVALHPVTPLNLKRNIVGPALGALAKELIEGWHGVSSKSYMKVESSLHRSDRERGNTRTQRTRRRPISTR